MPFHIQEMLSSSPRNGNWVNMMKKRSQSSGCPDESKPKAISHLEEQSKMAVAVTKIFHRWLSVRWNLFRDDIFISRNSEANCSSAHPAMRGITRTLSQSLSQQSLKIARSHLLHLFASLSSLAWLWQTRDFLCTGICGLSNSGLTSHWSTTSKPSEAKSWWRKITFILFYLPLLSI